MRKILAVATAASVMLSGVAPAMAADENSLPGVTLPSDYEWIHPRPFGEGSSQVTFHVGVKKDNDKKVQQEIVYDKDGKIVCDTASSKADFMWSAGGSKCIYKKPIDVIKDVAAYITAIAGAIGALFAIFTTAQKFIK